MRALAQPVTDPPGPSVTPHADGRTVGPGSVLLSVAAALVGFASYACNLAMAHLLRPPDYSDFAAAQVLLGVVGLVAAALTPLPLVHVVRSHPRGSEGRRTGMAFACGVSAAAGVVAALITAAVTAAFAPAAVVIAVGASALALFTVTPLWGWLQGELRFQRLATATVVEVTVRLTFSVIAVLLGWGAGGALAGFAVGAVVALLAAPGALRRDLVWRPRTVMDRWRWRETGDIAVTQLVVATLIGADIVLVGLLDAGGDRTSAGYQAVSALAKAPIYVAAGAVVVVFPLLRSRSADVADILVATLRSLGMLALPAAAVLATVPAELMSVVLPREYSASVELLPVLAAAGIGYAVLTVLATVLLGMRAYRRCQLALLAAAFVLPGCLVLGQQIGGVDGLAVGAAVGALGGGTVMWATAAPLLPPGSLRRAVRGLAAAVPLLALLWLVRSHPVLWVFLVLLVGGAVLLAVQQRRPGDGSGPGTADPCSPPAGGRSLRILHLGFEDPAMPGAGGGSVRTHEVNRRIAVHDQVTVLVQRFPGGADRTEDGVRYVHIGLGSGRNRLTRLLGYVALLPVAVRRHPADLVVEDFFAPVSTLAAPLWTGRPTIGVVQWLEAGAKARQYKVPLQFVERFGVRRHHRLIAVSRGVEADLRAINPRLTVDVIGNGIVPEALEPATRLGQDVLFVGRLEMRPKGIDILLLAWSLACRDIEGRLIIAGRGPDERRIRRLVADLGLEDRVQFVGWVAGRTKYELFASARLVAVPSLHESFGLVALEALATGTPVVAFDIPCLREVIPDGCGRKVRPFDVHAYGAALVSAHRDLSWILAAAPQARAFAARWDWDAAAARQRAVYAEAATVGASR